VCVCVCVCLHVRYVSSWKGEGGGGEGSACVSSDAAAAAANGAEAANPPGGDFRARASLDVCVYVCVRVYVHEVLVECLQYACVAHL